MALYQIVEQNGQKVLIEVGVGGGGAVTPTYELGEIYYFRNPTLRQGFQPCQGGLLEQAATLYPQIWAYLQTTEGQQLCTTESEWQAMTRATWGDGSFKASWNGIGGAPYFVQDLNAGTLRMPDMRGMFACAAGDGTYAPGMGASAGDRGRNFAGVISAIDSSIISTGPFYAEGTGYVATSGGNQRPLYKFDPSRVVPTGAVNIPRSWGALACAYLGQPATA